ncbi:hypothetical protein L218DRAFT_1071760 [Marasmius fiardii PR-910]|nr:hypothetical protein L218DRAFT_1071760 [Marasmius fiardii PR-910]
MHLSHHHETQQQASTQSKHARPLAQQSSLAASAVRSALSNPYATTYSSHYSEAYMQYSASNTTPEGFTYSSTYNPAFAYSNASVNIYSSSSSPSSSSGLNPMRGFSFSGNSSWYQAGNRRCTYKQCTFMGSAKSVEIHMADRHLIYPVGWQKRDKKSNWDADPSLKGKTIPIQGTNITLDTPDAIDAWIAERKKRWPTANLIQEKKRKLEEAATRGELFVEELGLFGKKRKLHGDEDSSRGRVTIQGRTRGRRTRGSMVGNQGGRNMSSIFENVQTVPRHPLPKKPPTEGSSSHSEDSDDGAPESMPVRPPSKELPVPSVTRHETTEPTGPIKNSKNTADTSKPIKRRPIQPKKAAHVPFGPKSSLLRNLLLPEIRVTVSNLSQAIRFIVDNDFFDAVELKPGEANEKKIEVIETKEINPESHKS